MILTVTRNLVIFDVDGTLTKTTCMDSDAYITAFKEYLQLSEINSNWNEYRYSTDSGFAIELFEKHKNRLARDEEIQAIKQKFFSLLEEKIIADPTCCLAIPGANTVFQRIMRLEHWDIAIATGCWLHSALTKLNYAHINYTGIPLACGDDHIERHEIINIAHHRAKINYKRNQYNTVIYVGDKLWDYHASQKLGIKFIGVGSEFLKNEKNAIPKINDYLTNDFIDHLKKLQTDYVVGNI